MNPKVEFFFRDAKNWLQEYARLRSIVLGCDLNEELKWGCPCYSFEGNNIVLIHGFKDYCALLFFKGALLKDPNGILIQQTKNVQAARQIRFASLQDIADQEAILKTYVQHAIEVDKAGLKVNFKKPGDLAYPEELQGTFDQDPALKKAFDALTPGRQRAYVLYFTAPKQSKTRVSRIEKSTTRILDGRGLDDE